MLVVLIFYTPNISLKAIIYLGAAGHDYYLSTLWFLYRKVPTSLSLSSKFALKTVGVSL